MIAANDRHYDAGNGCQRREESFGAMLTEQPAIHPFGLGFGRHLLV
jgi:hypothetical protein